MYPYPHPENTRSSNNQKRNGQDISKDLSKDLSKDFLRPIISNTSEPIYYNHESYITDNNSDNRRNIDNGPISTRNIGHVQSSFQNNYQNDYHMMNLNFENKNLEINNFLTRNTVNTRRDNIDKIRNIETQDFMKTQGGNLTNFTNIKYENTRKNKSEINSSNYIPMPKTMAIPKENI
jgi:hypothetical protein